MKKIFLQLFFCTIVYLPISIAAQDSSHLRISLLTCTPGDELYSTFGHSALRVTDSSSVQDIVFNYGTFDFDDPGFYTKFVKGKLMYYVSPAKFRDFAEEYQMTNRGITEQVLNLTAEEKIAVQRFLYKNIKEENKYYKYDFLFDNCTTRLRDIIFRSKKNKPVFNPIVPAGTTFRNGIHEYLNRNDKEWSKLGIDILLGAPTDAVMDATTSQFLPDNLMKALDSSNHGNHLVLSKSSLYRYEKMEEPKSWFNPLIVFSLLLLAIVLLDFFKTKLGAAFLSGFDVLLFFVTGVLGILLCFMWFGTDHSMCKNNYNLIWAWPTHAIAAFFISSKKKWLKKYLLITVAGLLIALMMWMFIPQQLNISLLAICLLLIYRSLRKYAAI
ncbi:MAG: DUF4105 domain-containing protein [Chitinophagaceae bacterium]|nr:DUF4105 domain-containing protein [Chitinophagaceae bacterium]